MKSKRINYLNWDEFFISVAHLCAKRSKDPDTQVGACIVNKLNQIIASGYNGLPRGLNDDLYPWSREGSMLDTKYTYIAHAELNAIVSSRSDLTESKLYVSLFPCHECAKIIIQSGISEIIYDNDKYIDTDSNKAAKRMFNDACVFFRKINSVEVFVDTKLNRF